MGSPPAASPSKRTRLRASRPHDDSPTTRECGGRVSHSRRPRARPRVRRGVATAARFRRIEGRARRNRDDGSTRRSPRRRVSAGERGTVPPSGGRGRGRHQRPRPASPRRGARVAVGEGPAATVADGRFRGRRAPRRVEGTLRLPSARPPSRPNWRRATGARRRGNAPPASRRTAPLRAPGEHHPIPVPSRARPVNHTSVRLRAVTTRSNGGRLSLSVCVHNYVPEGS